MDLAVVFLILGVFDVVVSFIVMVITFSSIGYEKRRYAKGSTYADVHYKRLQDLNDRVSHCGLFLLLGLIIVVVSLVLVN